MKFLATLCFFASAIMALATPPVIESNNKVPDATTSSQLEAAQHISLDKREPYRFTFRVPFGQRFPGSYQVFHTTLSFVMTDHWEYAGLRATGWFCEALRFVNYGSTRTVAVSLYKAITGELIRYLVIPVGVERLVHDMHHLAGMEIFAFVTELPSPGSG